MTSHNEIAHNYNEITSVQRNCIFPGRCAPLTYYDWLRGRPRNTLMARNAREICNFFAHLYLHNG